MRDAWPFYYSRTGVEGFQQKPVADGPSSLMDNNKASSTAAAASSKTAQRVPQLPGSRMASRQNSITANKKTAVDPDAPSITVDISTKPGGRMGSIRIRPSESPDRKTNSPSKQIADTGTETGGRERVNSAGSGNKSVSSRRTIESARKKILYLASKNEWASLEQNLKSLELSVAGSKDPADQLPLAGLQEEVNIYFYKKKFKSRAKNQIFGW